MSFQRLTQALTCCTLGQSINEYVMYMHAYSHTRKPSFRWPLHQDLSNASLYPTHQGKGVHLISKEKCSTTAWKYAVILSFWDGFKPSHHHPSLQLWSRLLTCQLYFPLLTVMKGLKSWSFLQDKFHWKYQHLNLMQAHKLHYHTLFCCKALVWKMWLLLQLEIFELSRHFVWMKTL